MKNQRKINEVILREQKIGNSFAFMIDQPSNNQIWIVVKFLFYEFQPELKCEYFIQKYKKRIKENELIEEFTFKNIHEAISYLVDQKVNPDYCRALH